MECVRTYRWEDIDWVKFATMQEMLLDRMGEWVRPHAAFVANWKVQAVNLRS